jgi:zona occludens toxin
MITLLTGVPGAGKTCYSMSFLVKAIAENRPIFQHGIPKLKLAHEPVYCTARSCKYCEDNKPEGDVLLAENWEQWAPDGAYLVFDEVQHVYRPRANGTAPPPSVMAFETHRHRGLDFLLMTQSPMLFDTNVRKLVSRHIHLKGNWAGRNQYEWGECSDDPKKIATAVKSSYKLKKSHFKLYKSAELHTKIERKMPFQVYILVAAILGAGVMGFRTYNRFNETVNDDVAVTEEINSQLGYVVEGSTAAVPTSNYGDRYAQQEMMFPESAPVFTEIVEVKTFPRLAACISKPSGSCQCYTQQATRLIVPAHVCFNFVDSPPFNPYLDSENNEKSDNFNNSQNVKPARYMPFTSPAGSLTPELVTYPSQLPYNTDQQYAIRRESYSP